MIKNKVCTVCGVVFKCGQTESNGGCWCNNFPPLFSPDPVNDCMCPDCLHNKTKEKIDEYVAHMTPEKALHENKAKELPSTRHYVEGIDYYKENDNWVFTAWYHLKRGHCCESGCRHCPYGFIKTN